VVESSEDRAVVEATLGCVAERTLGPFRLALALPVVRSLVSDFDRAAEQALFGNAVARSSPP
jgi:hypothetical protein